MACDEKLVTKDCHLVHTVSFPADSPAYHSHNLSLPAIVDTPEVPATRSSHLLMFSSELAGLFWDREDPAVCCRWWLFASRWDQGFCGLSHIFISFAADRLDGKFPSQLPQASGTMVPEVSVDISSPGHRKQHHEERSRETGIEW